MTLHEQEVASTAAGLTSLTQGIASQKREGPHPLFSAVHSVILAHRYGDQFDLHPLDYYNHPELRSAHTRMAMNEGLQAAAQRFGRGPRSGGTPPPAAGPVPQPGGLPPQPAAPGQYQMPPGVVAGMQAAAQQAGPTTPAPPGQYRPSPGVTTRLRGLETEMGAPEPAPPGGYSQPMTPPGTL